MAKGSQESQQSQQSTFTGSSNTRPGLSAPRGFSAATAGMRRRRLGGSGSVSPGDELRPSNMLRFYTDEAPGLKISPTVVLIMSLCFIGFVTGLHVFISV